MAGSPRDAYQWSSTFKSVGVVRTSSGRVASKGKTIFSQQQEWLASQNAPQPFIVSRSPRESSRGLSSISAPVSRTSSQPHRKFGTSAPIRSIRFANTGTAVGIHSGRSSYAGGRSYSRPGLEDAQLTIQKSASQIENARLIAHLKRQSPEEAYRISIKYERESRALNERKALLTQKRLDAEEALMRQERLESETNGSSLYSHAELLRNQLQQIIAQEDQVDTAHAKLDEELLSEGEHEWAGADAAEDIPEPEPEIAGSGAETSTDEDDGDYDVNDLVERIKGLEQQLLAARKLQRGAQRARFFSLKACDFYASAMDVLELEAKAHQEIASIATHGWALVKGLVRPGAFDLGSGSSGTLGEMSEDDMVKQLERKRRVAYASQEQRERKLDFAQQARDHADDTLAQMRETAVRVADENDLTESRVMLTSIDELQHENMQLKEALADSRRGLTVKNALLRGVRWQKKSKENALRSALRRVEALEHKLKLGTAETGTAISAQLNSDEASTRLEQALSVQQQAAQTLRQKQEELAQSRAQQASPEVIQNLERELEELEAPVKRARSRTSDLGAQARAAKKSAQEQRSRIAATDGTATIMRARFDRFDEDGDGKLNKLEVRKMMETMEIEVNDLYLDKLFGVLDEVRSISLLPCDIGIRSKTSFCRRV